MIGRQLAWLPETENREMKQPVRSARGIMLTSDLMGHIQRGRSPRPAPRHPLLSTRSVCQSEDSNIERPLEREMAHEPAWPDLETGLDRAPGPRTPVHGHVCEDASNHSKKRNVNSTKFCSTSHIFHSDMNRCSINFQS